MEQYYGNSMAVYHDGSVSEGKFMTFVHIDHKVMTTFLEISLATTKLTVTANHLVYKLRNSCIYEDTSIIPDECMDRVFSESLVPGDFMFVLASDTNTLNTEKIVTITKVTRVGIYSPMPESGHKFFVSNVLVSPFSSVNVPFLNHIHYGYAKFASYFN
jgi:hypothetical protein